jgi:hypothetical protein
MRLVEVEGWITPQELTLADDLVRVIELARWTDYDRRLAIADLNGWEERRVPRRLVLSERG